MPLVARDKPPEVLQPREEPLDLPATAVAAELASVLGAAPTIGAVRRDEFDAPLGHLGVQRVAVVAAIADDPRRQPPQKPGLQRVGDERDFPGICTCDSNGERKTSSVCEGHDLGAFAFASEADAGAPFFADAKVASMNVSVKSYPPAAASSRANWWSTRASVPWRAQS